MTKFDIAAPGSCRARPATTPANASSSVMLSSSAASAAAVRAHTSRRSGSVAVCSAPSAERVENAALRRQLERSQADLQTARRVIEVQGNVSALLGELLEPRGAKPDESSEP